jgi:hypothetical protein
VEFDGHISGMSWPDLGHAVLDVVGLVPVVGEVADVANGIWYAAEGNYVGAALSMSSAIPFLGYGAAAVKALRWGDRVIDAVDTANDARGSGHRDHRRPHGGRPTGAHAGGHADRAHPGGHTDRAHPGGHAAGTRAGGGTVYYTRRRRTRSDGGLPWWLPDRGQLHATSRR